MSKKLEICCYSVESALLAEQAGADRVELCDNYNEGGTTPSYAAIKLSVNQLKIPVNVIVRPRGGDFLYSDIEYDIIKEDIRAIKNLNANGIVVGFLKEDGEVDLERTQEIIELAAPMELTFHRAFDRTKNPIESVKQLAKIGVKRILTSGCKNKAEEGTELIKQLVKEAGQSIIIMPGSGVNEKNIQCLITSTNAFEFHSSAKTFVKSHMKYNSQSISMGGNSSVDEENIVSVNSEQIFEMKTILKQN